MDAQKHGQEVQHCWQCLSETWPSLGWDPPRPGRWYPQMGGWNCLLPQALFASFLPQKCLVWSASHSRGYSLRSGKTLLRDPGGEILTLEKQWRLFWEKTACETSVTESRSGFLSSPLGSPVLRVRKTSDKNLLYGERKCIIRNMSYLKDQSQDLSKGKQLSIFLDLKVIGLFRHCGISHFFSDNKISLWLSELNFN